MTGKPDHEWACYVEGKKVPFLAQDARVKGAGIIFSCWPLGLEIERTEHSGREEKAFTVYKYLLITDLLRSLFTLKYFSPHWLKKS